MPKAYYLSKTGGVGPLITKSQGRYKDHFKGNIVNSLLKGENVGITRRTNRAPAVTTQATTTTHTRTVQRSHSPSHAPSGPQTTVISNNSSSSSGGNSGSSNSKKKRKENKDVTPVSTPPVVPQEQPEKGDKTLEKPGKEKTLGTCASAHKSKKERKRKSDEPVEEEKKPPSCTPEKRPRSNSGNSEPSQERVELSKGETLESVIPGSETNKSEPASKPDKVWQSNTTPVQVESKPREDIDVGCNSSKTKSKAVNKQEQAISSDTKDSRSSTPDSVKKHKSKSKKEHRLKQIEPTEDTPLVIPAIDQSRVTASTNVTTSVSKQMVESKTEATGTGGLRPPIPEKEANRKNLREFPSNVLREQSLTSAIAGIIARELNRDSSDVSSGVSKKPEPNSVTSGISTSEIQPSSVCQQITNNSSITKSSISDRSVKSGPITTALYTSSSQQSVLPNRTIASSNSVPVISHSNGGLTGLPGMDRNSSGISSENTKLSNSTNLSSKPFAQHPVLGERIARPEARDPRRETSSSTSEKSEGGKSSSTDRSRDSDQSRTDKKTNLVTDLKTPVQVYRDPNLSDSEVIHVDSIQHHPAHLMKIGDQAQHTPSPGQHPITPSPHALRNPSATAAPANPSAIVASPSAFVAAPSVGHIPSHHPIQHHGHAMFPAHLQLYQQHPLASQLVVPGHFPQHHLAGLDRHSLQQLHTQGLVGLVQPDPMTRIRLGGIHGIVSPQHAATALQGSMHTGLTQAQLQAIHQQHPGLPLPPSWVIQQEELERAHLQQQKTQAAAAAAAEKGSSSLPHHPSAPTSQVRIDPTPSAASSVDKKPHPAHLPAGSHPQHHTHPQLMSVSQAAQGGAQGLVGHESAAAAAVAAHHARHQYQELDAQAAVQQHFQESLRKLQVPFSFSAPTTGGSITEGTALPKNKGQLPKEAMDRQHKERQEHEERLRREREEKELEWQRIQRDKERKHQDSDPRLRFPGMESESVYKHPVSEGKHPYDDPLYRQSLAHAGLVRYQEELAKYPMDLKHEPKIKLERTELNARTHDGPGFKAYQSSVRSDAHTTYYNTLSMKSEEPRAGVPVRTEQNRQMATASAYKPKPDNLVGYQPFLHTITSHGGEKGEPYSKHSEEYKMAANAAAMQGARRAIPTPPPLIKREPDRSEIALHSSVVQASRSERRPETMHHAGAVFTAASSSHDIHFTQASKHLALSDVRTNNEVSHSVPVIKHTIGTPPPLHSSAGQTTASQLVRQSHIPPQSPLKVATPQQLSAAVLQLGSHSVSSTTATTMGVYPHHVYSTAQTTTATSSNSLLMSALRPQDITRVSEAMEVDQGTMKRKPSHAAAAMFHKKRPKTKEDMHSDSGNLDKKESTGMSYIEQYHNFVMEPNAHNSTSVGNATVCKATENIELKIEKVDQYKRLSLDSSAPASLLSGETHKTPNGTCSDGESNRCISPRSTASDSSEGRSLKSASPHRAGGHMYLKKAWLARHSESKTPFGMPAAGASSTNNLDPKQEPGLSSKLSNSLPNGHLMGGTFAQVAQSMDADKSVTIDDIPKSIPNHIYDFDQDKSSTCSEASTVSSHKSRSRKSGKDRTKKKDRKRHGSPAESKKHGKDKGDKSEEKIGDCEKPKSEYVLGLEACRIMSNNVESKSTQQITELLNLIAQTPKKRKLTRSSKDSKDGQLNRQVTKPAVTKPTVTKLKKSGEAFLQDGYCSDITPNLMKCRECRIKPSSKQSKLNNIFCRFYAFRRLKYSTKGNLTLAGFSEPEQCDSEDLSPWLPYPPDSESKLDLETCLYILSRVGPQFCQLVQQEQQAKTWCPTPDKIAWKRAVIGVREMCDTCDTTLFNIHWTCSKCGFVVCLDCYHSKSNEEKNDENAPENGPKWLKCIKDQVHQPDSLMLTQMIPGNALWDVGELMHQVCTKWRIPSACPCLGDGKPAVNGMSPTSGQIASEWKRDDLLSSTALSGHLSNSRSNRMPKLTSLPQSASPLAFLADIATSQDGKRGVDGKKLDGLNSKSVDKACSVDVDAKGEPCSTLRDLLTKTAGKLCKPSPNDGNLLTQLLPKVDGISKKTSRTMTSTFEDIIATVVEQNISAPGKDRSGVKTPRLSTSSVTDTTTSPSNSSKMEKKGKTAGNRNTLVESSVTFPDVPHSWLCDGRLLRLHDPSHAGNLRIFQEQWRKGEPILVSNVHKQLDDNLWHPTFFNKHFGHLENDLVDCRSGDVITGAPMRDFWNGFEDISNRLETKQGLPIILKLKDWPPAQDFSELLPRHFQDLMNNLPLPDYTRRDGRFNLSSRLPDFFVKPDLGPKMYNAYGLARYSSCGTTNLHLDISDAVNVMVYVGKPHSIDGQETCDSYEKEAIEAVNHMCMDEQTKQRVREKEERPGAIWHLFRAADTNKIRQFLCKLSEEKGEDVPTDHDPIHDQSWYLDNELLDRLYKEYGVQGWAIAQCWGDAIFIPAGAPHQVRNVHSSIKVAEDFVSPEHISECFWLTQEFRQLSATHSNHEDKLQVKNIIYHAIKDTIGLLVTKTPPGELTDPIGAGKVVEALQQQQQQQLLLQQPQTTATSQHHQQPQHQQQLQQQQQVPQQLVAKSPQSKPSPASTPPVTSNNTCSSS
ncbi:probable JmjC domain-containing histone demethylation protein 2C isoform X3 [Lytechinus variegatus]|uniref:probable JmjC domain-containing histone demethylation protein 2C isoform X3 n=1 Tax=Lytechinus variegatus TaxID=7654 RepID=UPI001BB0E3C7|nr:probable JmjC domain-containing histone demethylation protein 2C isoform X3 [Lytechinus variegatus]